MAEMSAGCRTAWERWWRETYPEYSSEQMGFVLRIQALDVAYAAGFEAALAALERYTVHSEERAAEFGRLKSTETANLFHSYVSMLRLASEWVRQGLNCDLTKHTRCQEAQKR